MTPEVLSALRDRLIAATGMSNTLNGEMAVMFGGIETPTWRGAIPPPVIISMTPTTYANGQVEVRYAGDDAPTYCLPPNVTGSIDAALGLVTRLLPGWACGFDRGPKTCIAFVDPHDHEDRFTGARHTATAPTAPLALLAALVSALSQPGVQP